MIKPQPPRIEQDSQDHAEVRLAGSWVLATALPQAELLQAVPDGVRRIDARGIGQLDSAGVLQLLRFASRMGLKEDAIDFRDEHQALVCTIEELNDERPKPKRDYGFVAALDRLGRTTHGVGQGILELNSFLGENLVKIGRLIHEPRRFRLTSTVHHMEQVGLDAVPLVVLLSYLVGAVIAFWARRSCATSARRSMWWNWCRSRSCANLPYYSPLLSWPAAPPARLPRRSAR